MHMRDTKENQIATQHCGVVSVSDLSSLRSEVSDALSAGPDLRLEHEVEREGIREGVALRGEDGVALEALLELQGIHGAGVALDTLELRAGFLAQVGLLVRQSALAVLLEKLVCAVGHVLLRGGNHEIGETGNVTRRPEKERTKLKKKVATRTSAAKFVHSVQPPHRPPLLFALSALFAVLCTDWKTVAGVMAGHSISSMLS